jgi:hypothetical protein
MSDNPRCLIEKIKAKFETLRTIMGDDFSPEDIRQPKYLRALLSATEEAYVLLNDGICESLHMCKECAHRRDMLMRYLHLLDDADRDLLDDSDRLEMLHAYPKEVNEVLDRIERAMKAL